jgi:hypothetical protein
MFAEDTLLRIRRHTAESEDVTLATQTAVATATGDRSKRTDERSHSANRPGTPATIRRARNPHRQRDRDAHGAVALLTGGVARGFKNLQTVIIGGLGTILCSRPEEYGRSWE